MPPASAANTDETLRRLRSRISATRSGFAAARPARSSARPDRRQAHRRRSASSSCCTCGLHDPQPVPARVASQSARMLRHPLWTACAIRPFVTPLQLQICASSGRSAARGGSVGARRACERKEQLGAIVGQRLLAIEGLQKAGRRIGIAEQDRAGQPSVADDQLLVDAARRLRVLHDLVILSSGSLSPIAASSMPITFNLVDTREPR